MGSPSLEIFWGANETFLSSKGLPDQPAERVHTGPALLWEGLGGSRGPRSGGKEKQTSCRLSLYLSSSLHIWASDVCLKKKILQLKESLKTKNIHNNSHSFQKIRWRNQDRGRERDPTPKAIWESLPPHEGRRVCQLWNVGTRLYSVQNSLNQRHMHIGRPHLGDRPFWTDVQKKNSLLRESHFPRAAQREVAGAGWGGPVTTSA